MGEWGESRVNKQVEGAGLSCLLTGSIFKVSLKCLLLVQQQYMHSNL
jgi:hypothetical protein